MSNHRSQPLKISEILYSKRLQSGLQKYKNLKKLQLFLQTCVRDVRYVTYVTLRIVHFQIFVEPNLRSSDRKIELKFG
jgi:hypothetical protein